MDRLIWYEAGNWSDALESGRAQTRRSSVKPYPFPMEEVLFRLLLQAKIGVSHESTEYLRRLRDVYRADHEEPIPTPEELIQEGWIDSFCGRWALAGYMRDTFSETGDAGLDGTLRFLSWLRKAPALPDSGVYLEDWDKALDGLRAEYPALPETEWFVAEHIAEEDKRHFQAASYAPYHVHLDHALVRLWFYGEPAISHRQWIELASQLHLTASVLELLPYDAKAEAIAILSERVLAGEVPTAAAENRRARHRRMLETGDFKLAGWIPPLRENDPVENLHTQERWGWEDDMRLYERRNFLCFELAAAGECLHSIPEERLPAVLGRMADIFERGMLQLGVLSPAASMQLLEYKQTQFLALHSLLARPGGRKTAAGECVLAWLRFALKNRAFDNADGIGKLLLYLSGSAYGGTVRERWEKKLTEDILLELGKGAVRRPDFTNGITQTMQEALDGSHSVCWSRRFHLLCAWTEELTAAAGNTGLLEMEALYRYLLTKLEWLFNEPYHEEATFVSPELFQLSFWPKLYELADYRQKSDLRDPVRGWLLEREPDVNEHTKARYQCILALAWLVSLAGSIRTSEMQAALESFLAYVLKDKDHILYAVYRDNEQFFGTIKRAVRALKVDAGGDSPLFALDAAGLLTVARFTEDEPLREKLLALVAELPAERALDVFCWEQITEDALEQRVEPFYEACEKLLAECIERCEQTGRTAPDTYRRCRLQLSRLWYLRGDYDTLFKNGEPWWIAVALTEKGPRQDLNRAKREWRGLAGKLRQAAPYLNWLLCCAQLLEIATDGEERETLYREIAELRERVEDKFFLRWKEDERLHYELSLVCVKMIAGLPENAAIERIAAELRLTREETEKLRTRWVEKQGAQTVAQPPTSEDDRHIAEALRDFRGLSFSRQATAYLRSMDAPLHEDRDLTLVLREVLRTMYHLSNYGDKLVVDKKLLEDRCTQLVRELFNQGIGDWLRLAANDQQQSGSTGTVRRGLRISAENDLIIREGEYERMMVEALVLESCEKDEIAKHLLKLIGDSREGLPLLLLIYGNAMDSEALWRKIGEYLNGGLREQAKGMGISIAPFALLRKQGRYYHPNLFHVRLDPLVDHTLVTHASLGGTPVPVFVTYADVGKAKNFQVSQEAREI